MIKKKEESFVGFMKKLGWVLGPILAVASITKLIFNDNYYIKIAVAITIILLYIIYIEMRIKKLEKNARLN